MDALSRRAIDVGGELGKPRVRALIEFQRSYLFFRAGLTAEAARLLDYWQEIKAEHRGSADEVVEDPNQDGFGNWFHSLLVICFVIAVISSTIFPSDAPIYWGSPRRVIPTQERLEGTQKTIASLLAAKVDEIYLADNSGENWVAGTEEQLSPARVYVYHQHQFQNKGISELYLLLSIMEHLPAATPILKMSGRYYLKNGLGFGLDDKDVAANFVPYARTQLWMSTRCYLVKDKEVYERFLKDTLRALYGYQARIVGPGSLLRILRNSIFPERDDSTYDDPLLPIEIAAARVLQRAGYSVKEVAVLGIEGITGDKARRVLAE